MRASRMSRASHFASCVVVAILTIVLWQCNYSGSCASSDDCTGSRHVCVFTAADGCGGNGHCAALPAAEQCSTGAFRIFGCGCDGNRIEPFCDYGGYKAPVRSDGDCPPNEAADAANEVPDFGEASSPIDGGAHVADASSDG